MSDDNRPTARERADAKAREKAAQTAGGARGKAAAITAESARRDRNRRLAVIGISVLVLGAVLAALIWLSFGSSSSGKTPTADAVPARVEGNALVVGPDSAATKVVVHEDFLCPFCREFEMTSRDYLHADAQAGKVQVEYRPFQLLPDPYSKNALMVWAGVLSTGTPQQALAFHDALFDDQPNEAATDKPTLDALLDLAAGSGADRDKVSAWVSSDGEAWAAKALSEAQAAGIQGTPTVLANGKPLQGSTIADMADNLQKMIGSK